MKTAYSETEIFLYRLGTFNTKRSLLFCITLTFANYWLGT